MTVYCALFTALIIIGGYISIPIPVSPVPIVLTDFFVMLVGLFLGFKYGMTSTLLYLVLGLIGLPVFAGGRAGTVVLFGPTGGFLLGYLPLAASISLITYKWKMSVTTHLIALIIGNVWLYVFGVSWLKFQTGMNWMGAISMGFIPFIMGTLIKIILAVAIGRTLLPRFKNDVHLMEE
jgi:biotin transport system substrate-specific component